MKSLLLSAGLGTRLRPFTEVLPKPVIPMMGLPIMYYSLYLLREAGCVDVVVNLHHLAEKIKNQLKDKELKDFKFEFSHEIDRPLGSGGGISFARSFLKDEENFFVINADEVMTPKDSLILQELHDEHKRHSALSTLLLTPHPQLFKTLKPVWVDKEGYVKGFGDNVSNKSHLTPLHYTGYKIFNQEIFDVLPEGQSNIFYEVLLSEIAKGKPVRALVKNIPWWETGSWEHFLTATKDLIQLIHQKPEGNYIFRLREAFGLNNDFRTIISGKDTVATLNDFSLKKIHTFGTVFIDDNITIKEGLSVENSIINKGAIVRDHIKNQMIFGA